MTVGPGLCTIPRACQDVESVLRFERLTAWETEKGLMLTRPFYQLLSEFEQSGKPFDQFLPTMLDHLPEYGR